MTLPDLPSRRRLPARGVSRARPLAAFAALAWLAGGAAQAGCIDSTDPDDRRLESLAESDANKAVQLSRDSIARLLKASTPDAPRLAFLYGVQAYGYQMLELDSQAREAAATGLRWARPGADATRLNLQIIDAENAYDPPALAQALGTIEAARQSVQPGSMADTCLLIALGRMQYRQSRIDLAVHNITWAYQNSIKAHHARQRVLAAAALSFVMRAAGDYAQAQSLIREVIEWDTAHDLKLDLSVARYLLGTILGEVHDNLHAIDELQQARRLSEQLGDTQGVAFSDMRICENQAELNASATARGNCERALHVFQANHTSDMVKETRATLAQLDLLDGRPAAALATLNALLDQRGVDVLPRSVERMYKLRAQAEARLGNYKAAYSDFAEYLRRDQETNQSERARQVTALRMRFDADRELERNESLQRQLALEHERTERQRAQLRWTAALAATAAVVIALMSYIVVTTLRHRRQLLRLAGEDPLTGLPNRRQTAQLAEAALANAARRGQVLTLALLDLDHFKRINDQCGHAEGDRALQEFARRARQEVRAGDIFGRWGGEEFLLVMSDCTLDLGLVTLERLRGAVGRIALPAGIQNARLTLSAGLTTNEDHMHSLGALVARADAALYEAKHGGRDRVRVSEETYRTASTGVRRALRDATG